MKNRDLIERLQQCNPDAEVQIEQTNDGGPETVSQVVEYDYVVVLEGDPFR